MIADNSIIKPLTDEELKVILKRVVWDYNISEDDLLFTPSGSVADDPEGGGFTYTLQVGGQPWRVARDKTNGESTSSAFNLSKLEDKISLIRIIN
jgi:hypothetical protein